MRKIWVWLLTAVMLTSLAGCAGGESRGITMGTGGIDGIYYSYGGVLGQQILEHAGIPVNVVETGGSLENIQGLASGDFQMAMVQSDVMSYAWQGRRTFDETRVDSFRAIGSLYTEPIQLVTVNPEIHYADELRGMRISMGTLNSGIYFNATDILDAVSLTLEDIQPMYMDIGETVEALKEGTIDAAFLVAGAPIPALQKLWQECSLRLVPIEGPVAERILTSCPFYTVHTIPVGTYSGQTEDVKTLAVRATLLVSDQESKDRVYEITRAIFDHQEAIRSCNPRGRELDLQKVTEGVNIPFHPGAVKYFREQGIEVS